MTKERLQQREIGFGIGSPANRKRFLNSDGTTNVKRVGNSRYAATDVFHELITMSWVTFSALVFSVYTFFNLTFAVIYFFLGVEKLGIAREAHTPLEQFSEAFFFSTQCFTTVGFGRVSPLTFSVNLIASIDCLFGLMSLAIITGLLYGRFSRPSPELVKSDNILIAPFKEGKALMFRIASSRNKSLLLENTVSVSMGINELDENNNLKRQFYGLDMQLSFVSSMPLSWTLVHPIDDKSPLWGKSVAELKEGSTEFIVFFKAVDETTSQTVYERFSYYHTQIVADAKFNPMFYYDQLGTIVLDLHKINDHSLITS